MTAKTNIEAFLIFKLYYCFNWSRQQRKLEWHWIYFSFYKKIAFHTIEYSCFELKAVFLLFAFYIGSDVMSANGILQMHRMYTSYYTYSVRPDESVYDTKQYQICGSNADYTWLQRHKIRVVEVLNVYILYIWIHNQLSR